MQHPTIHWDAKKNLLICIDPRVSLAAASVWFRAGSRFDAQGKEGVAHLFEHLLLRGAVAKDPNAYLIEQEARGVVGSAYVNYETSYTFSIGAVADAGAMTRTLLERSLDRTEVSSTALRTELQAVRGEIREAHNDAISEVRILSNTAVWPESELGRNLYGTPESLAKIRVADLQQFWNDRYQAALTVCVVPTEEAAQQIRRISMKTAALPEVAPAVLRPVISEVAQASDREGVAMCVAYRVSGQSDWKSHAVAAVVRDYLTNFWSSRLNQELRSKKAYAYWVRGETTHLAGTGVLRILLETDAANVSRCRKRIAQEIDTLRAGKCDAALLRTCKKMVVLAQQRAWSDPEELLWWYGWPTALGVEPMTTDAWVELVQSITARDVTKFANTWLQPEQCAVALLGAVQN